MRTLPLFFIALGSALAQSLLYADLTPGQRTAIETANQAFDRWRADKFARQSQIQQELFPDDLTPLAFGLRHAELETIDREIFYREVAVRRPI